MQQVGQPLPELAAQTPDGRSMSVQAELKGQPVLVNFLHGIWCADCVRQLHWLERHRPELAALGAKILVITRDQPAMLAAFLASALPALGYPVVADPEGIAHERVGAGGHTMSVIVDRDRTIRWVTHLGDRIDQAGYETVLHVLHRIGAKKKPQATR
jgi:peroxiredoxin